MKDIYEVVAKIAIPDTRVADLVCCALEGGSTYWCMKFKPEGYPPGIEWGHEAVAAGTPFDIWPEDDEPLHVSNSPAHIQETLQLMSERHPDHWQDFINANEDANTGDIFFQLLCFGKEVYG